MVQTDSSYTMANISTQQDKDYDEFDNRYDREHYIFIAKDGIFIPLD